MSTSSIIPLVIEKPKIVLTAEELANARRWIREMDAGQPLKMVVGTYGPWAHKFISPDSPEGKLLGMGLKAVPVMVEALADENTSPERRRWLLSLLYTTVGAYDPRDEVIENIQDYDAWKYEYVVGPDWGTDDEAPNEEDAKPREGHPLFHFMEDRPKLKGDIVKKWQRWVKACDVELLDEE